MFLLILILSCQLNLESAVPYLITFDMKASSTDASSRGQKIYFCSNLATITYLDGYNGITFMKTFAKFAKKKLNGKAYSMYVNRKSQLHLELYIGAKIENIF